MQKYNVVLALVSLAFASCAFAQSTSTTMDMGGGMTHVDTMGPNGAMSSSNCMNMGGGMSSCQTMDMSQPQRTYPTPDMSRPRRPYARPEASEPEPTYSAPYPSRWPLPATAVPTAPSIGSAITAPVPAATAAQSNGPITPAQMTLVSSTPIEKGAPDWTYGDALFVGATDRNGRWFSKEGDAEYATSYLGHAFALVGPKGMAIEDVRAAFDREWRDNPWVVYSSTNAGTIYYFSITSEKIYSDHIEVWVKGDHSKDRTRKARTSKILYEVKCDGQIIRDLLSFTYDTNGSVLSSFEYPGTAQRVIPETIGSALHEEMCRLKP